jgi:hypothetical protein
MPIINHRSHLARSGKQKRWNLFVALSAVGFFILVFRRKVLELLFDFLQQFKSRCHPGNDGLNPARYSPYFV